MYADIHRYVYITQKEVDVFMDLKRSLHIDAYIQIYTTFPFCPTATKSKSIKPLFLIKFLVSTKVYTMYCYGH